MHAIFLSDNYYLYAGVSNSSLSSRFVTHDKDIMDIKHSEAEMNYIIAIEQEELRNKTIKLIRNCNSNCIVLLNEIELNSYVKFNNVIYTSYYSNVKLLKHLVDSSDRFKQIHFTLREYEVLKLSHLQNYKIARRLKLSEKTTSFYRVRIQNKLKMRTKSLLAMTRVKSLLVG